MSYKGPYPRTFEETARPYDLRGEQLAEAERRVAAIECPIFSVHIYNLTHSACSELTNNPKETTCT